MAKGTVNKVILLGKLGADPDVRYTGSGMAITNLNLATNERVKNSSGEWEDQTEWHRVVMFGKMAENAANFLSKGKTVYIEGRLKTESWEDGQGQKKYTTKIYASDMQFIGGSGQGGGQASSDAASGGDDGIPF
jgi:single-strand DNA-binding protein